MKMSLIDKIKEGIKEGFSSKAMRIHGSSYTIVGTMVALPLYLVASTMSAEQEAQDLFLVGGHIASIHAFMGATLYGIGRYRKNKME